MKKITILIILEILGSKNISLCVLNNKCADNIDFEYELPSLGKNFLKTVETRWAGSKQT